MRCWRPSQCSKRRQNREVRQIRFWSRVVDDFWNFLTNFRVPDGRVVAVDLLHPSEDEDLWRCWLIGEPEHTTEGHSLLSTMHELLGINPGNEPAWATALADAVSERFEWLDPEYPSRAFDP